MRTLAPALELGDRPAPMPLAKLAQETIRIGLLALIFFALARWAAERWDIPGLKAALGASGTLA